MNGVRIYSRYTIDIATLYIRIYVRVTILYTVVVVVHSSDLIRVMYIRIRYSYVCHSYDIISYI